MPRRGGLRLLSPSQIGTFVVRKAIAHGLHVEGAVVPSSRRHSMREKALCTLLRVAQGVAPPTWLRRLRQANRSLESACHGRARYARQEAVVCRRRRLRGGGQRSDGSPYSLHAFSRGSLERKSRIWTLSATRPPFTSTTRSASSRRSDTSAGNAMSVSASGCLHWR